MKINLSITIMTHPKRKDEYFFPLYKKLLIEYERFKIYKEKNHIEDDVLISYSSDFNSEGVWTNAKKSWRTYEKLEGITHQLVLQDDITICKDFIPAVINAVKRKPNELIGLYCPRKIVLEAKEKGESWVTITDGSWGQSNLLPVERVKEFLKWDEDHIDHSFQYDDSRMSMFLIKQNTPAWITVPSLIEHIGASESLVGNSNRNRVAKWFIGENTSALSIDWSKGIENPLRSGGSVSSAYWSYYHE